MTVTPRAIATVIGLCALAGIHGDRAAAQGNTDIRCGEFYEVVPGDTLRELALRAYEVGSYQIIYNANQDILDNPSLLIVGQRLFIPCLDGSGPATREDAERRASADAAADIRTDAVPDATEATAEPDADGESEDVAAADPEEVGPAVPPPEVDDSGLQPLQPPVGATAADRIETASAAPAASGGAAEQRETAGIGTTAAPLPQEEPAAVQPLPSLLPNSQDSTAGAEAETAALTRAPRPGDSGRRQIRLLSGPYAPYTGEDLPEQGMLTEVVRTALEHAAPERPLRFTFIRDWKPHLSVLLPEGAFDLGYPWFKPDCSKIGLLSEGMKIRCTDFNWSAPLHELVIGYFVRADSPLADAADYDALAGTTICRPRGYYTFDLEQKGLKPPRIAMSSPDTPAECLEALVEGEIEVVSLAVTLAEGEIADLDFDDEVVEVADLADILTLHVLSAKSNPYGRTYLTLINKGLRQMRETGEWFEIVSRHLAEHSARAQ